MEPGQLFRWDDLTLNISLKRIKWVQDTLKALDKILLVYRNQKTVATVTIQTETWINFCFITVQIPLHLFIIQHTKNHFVNFLKSRCL